MRTHENQALVPAVTPKQQENKVSKMKNGTWEDRSFSFVGECIFEVFPSRRILPNGKVLRPTREMMRVTPTGVLEWFH